MQKIDIITDDLHILFRKSGFLIDRSSSYTSDAATSDAAVHWRGREPHADSARNLKMTHQMVHFSVL